MFKQTQGPDGEGGIGSFGIDWYKISWYVFPVGTAFPFMSVLPFTVTYFEFIIKQ